jgi:hypothetical protein
MKRVASVVMVGMVSLLVGCGGEESPGLRLGPSSADAKGGEATAVANAAAPSGPQCPAGVAAPKQISTEADVADLTLVGDSVYYRSLTKVVRVGKDGAKRTEVIESKDLVRAFVDANVMVLVESPTPPEAVLRVIALDELAAAATPKEELALLKGVTITTNANAGGTSVFGADAEKVYLLADETEAQVIYSIDKAKPGALTEIARITDAVVSHPQVAGGALWFVKDQHRVFRLALAEPEDQPQEVFGLGYASCGLAVSADHAFCATGAALEQRGLDGANVMAFLEREKSTGRVAVDSAKVAFGALVVRTESGPKDDALKGVLRSIRVTPNGVEETVVACGRESLSDVAVDATSIAWLEPSKGVFLAPR